jgi:tRNA (guanine-N7-)-methyltransferase
MDASQRRPIRSYVLRQGRVSKAQQRAHEALLPAFGIPFVPTLIDLDHAFGRRGPRVLEIGSGMGETTAAIAEAHPDTDYLAIEVHTPGVGSLLKQIKEKNLANVRVVQHDAVEVVRHMLPPESLSGVHIFFPDPWPKKRHHKRRLIQPEFVRLLATRMKRGAHLHVATDWHEYAQHILAMLSAETMLRNTAQHYAPRPSYRPQTKFETRGRNLGHEVWDIIFTRAL